MAYPFRRILVPHDGSQHAGGALDVAAALASSFDGSVVVLRAIAPFLSFAELGAEETTPWIPPEEVVGNELDRLESMVQKRLVRRPKPRVECRVIVGDAFTCIMDAARSADLIVMATHGRTGLDHLVIGSVAEKVVRHAPIPVLTIRKEGRRSGTTARPKPLRTRARKPRR